MNKNTFDINYMTIMFSTVKKSERINVVILKNIKNNKPLCKSAKERFDATFLVEDNIVLKNRKNIKGIDFNVDDKISDNQLKRLFGLNDSQVFNQKSKV